MEKKNDGRPFELHTTNADKAEYCKPIRNASLYISILFIVSSIWSFIEVGALSKEGILFSIFGVLAIISVIFYQKQINHYTKEAKIEE